MTYRLFLDDERFPPNDSQRWEIARSVGQARVIVKSMGCPEFISFDHDLGHHQLSGKDFANWLIDIDIDSAGTVIPSNFEYYVHSQNPVGVTNIKGLLDQYLLHRG